MSNNFEPGVRYQYSVPDDMCFLVVKTDFYSFLVKYCKEEDQFYYRYPFTNIWYLYEYERAVPATSGRLNTLYFMIEHLQFLKTKEFPSNTNIEIVYDSYDGPNYIEYALI